MRDFDRWLLVIPLGTAIVVIGTWLVPWRDGVGALLTILSPHLALAALGVTAVLAVVRGRTVRLGLLTLALVVVGRFGGEWLSIAPAMSGVALSVASWNLEYGDVDGRTTVAGLADLDVDIVALQELTPELALAIESSPAVSQRFPYRHLVPRPGVAGIGLLSRHPLMDPVAETRPVSLQATVDPTDGRRATILTAHPYPGRIETVTPERIPIGFDPSDRDAALGVLRERLDAVVDEGGAVILLGDFNVAPTEPAFADLAAGMADAHAEVGTGPGWTWRPSRFEHLPIGLLRIDYVLSCGDLAPVASRVECPPIGDHCIVIARLGGAGIE